MRIIYYLFLMLLFVALLPLLALLGFFIPILNGFPIFFFQKRTGLNGKPLTLYKFRTMIVGAERLQRQYRYLNESNGPVFKIWDDPRFTAFGRILSHTGLDELPQLFNVLKGDMALIGPRPLPVDEARKLKPWMRKRHDVKPGIISPWIFEGYHELSFDDWMRSDLMYIQKKSILFDCVILSKAVQLMLGLIYKELATIIGNRLSPAPKEST